MKKTILAAVFALPFQFAFATSWCTTSACYTNRDTALTPGCVYDCSVNSAAVIPLGPDELNKVCATSSDHVFCPNYQPPTPLFTTLYAH
jgi:hypothetical protein